MSEKKTLRDSFARALHEHRMTGRSCRYALGVVEGLVSFIFAAPVVGAIEQGQASAAFSFFGAMLAVGGGMTWYATHRSFRGGHRIPGGWCADICGQHVACSDENHEDLRRLARAGAYIEALTEPYEKQGKLPDDVQKKILRAMHMAEEPLSRLRVYEATWDRDIPTHENYYERADKRKSSFTFTRTVIDSKGRYHKLPLLTFNADTQTPTPEMPAYTRKVRVEADYGDAVVDACLELEEELAREQAPAPARRMTR